MIVGAGGIVLVWNGLETPVAGCDSSERVA